MTLYLVIYIEPNAPMAWHPLCICTCEASAKYWIAHCDTELKREWMSYMELPFYE